MAERAIATTSPSRSGTREPVRGGRTTLTAVLLVCGICSSLLYLGMLVFIPLGWEGYSSASQTISELSAIDAPTRPLWLWLGRLWCVLLAAFACGVWESARGKWSLRIVGGLLLVYAVISLGWPPMHQRAVLAAGGKTLTDTLHVVWMMATGLLMLLAMGISTAAFGKRFRWYSVITIVLLLGLGALTGVDAPRLEANLPTPWMGVWERITAGAMLLWIVVLASALLRRAAFSTVATRSRQARVLNNERGVP